MAELKIYKFTSLPTKAIPDSIFYIKATDSTIVDTYITDRVGTPFPLKDLTAQGVTSVESSDGSIVVTGVNDVDIVIAPGLLSLINGALQTGNNVSELVNDAGYITIADVPVTYTDEQAQDAVGNILVDTPTINLTYNDSTPSISANVIDNSISGAQLANDIAISEFVNDVNYTTVTASQNYADSKVEDQIVDGVTDKAPSQNAVFDAIANATIPDATATVKGKLKLTNDLGGTADAPTVPGLALKANDANVIHTTGDEVKTGTLETTAFIKTGGTSSQFLKADGSVDSTVYEDTANKGNANGYASLDSGGKVPVSQLPNSVMEYKGIYDASTNTPTLVDGIGNTGDVYRTTVAGAGVNSLNFVVGDYAVYNGTTWEKAHSGGDAVNSVFGRTGIVTAQNGDYTASQVTNVPSGNISSTTVQAALNELDSEKAIDANVIHTSGNETRTGSLTSDSFIKSGGTNQDVLLADGTTGTYSDIVAGGQLAQFTWKFSSVTTAANPGNGFFRANNATGSLTTQLYFSDITSNNQIDISNLFAAVNGNWLITIQQRNDASKWVQFSTSTAYIDNTGWWTVPVTWEQTGSGGTISSSTDCLFTFINKTSSATLVPNTRTLNVNGNTYDLSTNREWRVAQSDTGALTFGGITSASTTQVNIGACTGYIVDNETNPAQPTYTYINYAGETNKTVTTIGSGIITYVLLNSSGTVVFQNIFPTSAQRKSNIWLGKISHPNSTTIGAISNETDYITSPMAFARDMFQAINYINDGVYPYPSATNLTFATTSGNIHGNGINFPISRTTPNEIGYVGTSTTTFVLRTQAGTGGGAVTNVDPANYNPSGSTITAIGGGSNSSTIQYIFAVPNISGIAFVIQYGQTVYPTLADAVAAVGRELNYVVYPNLVSSAILVGVLCVNKSATNLTDTNLARFFRADKFGQIIGAQAGVSTGTLQTAYNNSLAPQIIVTDTLGEVITKNGRASNASNVEAWENIAGTITAKVTGNGDITGNSFIKTGGTSTQYLIADGSVKTVGQIAKTRKDITGTTYTLISSDVDKILYTTNASPVVITIPSGLTSNQEYEVYQFSVGQVSYVVSGTTLKYTSYEQPKHEETNTRVFVTWVDTETYKLHGELSAY